MPILIGGAGFGDPAGSTVELEGVAEDSLHAL